MQKPNTKVGALRQEYMGERIQEEVKLKIASRGLVGGQAEAQE